MDKIANTIGKGIIAGFVATFALSVLLDPIAMLTRTIWPSSPAVGWLVHFFIGTVLWGVAFAIMHDHLPGSSWQRGLIFAAGAWFVVAGGAYVLVEARLLAIVLDASLAISTLVVHMLYGVALGLVYGWLLDRESTPESRHGGHGDEPMHPFLR